MDKSEYLRLLSEASINDSSKFRAVPLERLPGKGRPPTYMLNQLSHWSLVAQLVEHRAVTREVLSSTPAGPTLRVLK